MPTETAKLTLPLPPSANRYYRNVRGIMVKSAEAKAFRIAVARSVDAMKLQPVDGPVCVRISVYRARKSGDLDNFLKVSLDSLQGICFHDDSQVVRIDALRFDDKQNPRLEVEVSRCEENNE